MEFKDVVDVDAVDTDVVDNGIGVVVGVDAVDTDVVVGVDAVDTDVVVGVSVVVDNGIGVVDDEVDTDDDKKVFFNISHISFFDLPLYFFIFNSLHLLINCIFVNFIKSILFV
jgi:hypothetical protein